MIRDIAIQSGESKTFYPQTVLCSEQIMSGDLCLNQRCCGMGKNKKEE